MNKVHKPDDPNAAYQREWRRKNKDKINARHRWRMENDPTYRQNLRDYHRAWRVTKGKSYVRNINLKNAHGITLADYNRMLEQQDGGCAICGGESWRNGRQIPFYVDHCHTTGQIRGLLCKNCNSGIGMLRDKATLVLSAYNYLTRPR